LIRSNPGKSLIADALPPDCAALHPGYGKLYLRRLERRTAIHIITG
jgi:hypothetical protein